MAKYRFIHFVARFGNRYMSGVADVGPLTTPVEAHEDIQLHICKQWHLSEMHKNDVIVERMECIE